MKILVTGFNPFGGENINPSYEAVKLLPDFIHHGKIIKLELPTVFKKSSDLLIQTIKKEKPQIVFCVGQAGGRTDLSFECIGINKDLGRIPDNEGNEPLGKKIREDGDDGYFSNLPIFKIVEALEKENIPASVSYTAGTYVCNHVLYSLMHYIKTSDVEIKGGFVHVPFIPAQVIGKRQVAHMGLDMIKDGLIKAIEVAMFESEDVVNAHQGNLD
ncbi:MAG: pyroglutamyl-peptidase I [Clostridia bacterium]|nr:pyroglutamyl-peptidase I [Clostridia bacterium]